MKRDENFLNGAERGDDPSAAGVTRRSLLRSGAAAVGGLLGVPAFAPASDNPQSHAASARGSAGSSRASSSYLQLLRIPDGVAAFERFEATLPAGIIALSRNGEQWSNKNVSVETRVAHDGLALTLTAPTRPIALVHLRWQIGVRSELHVLGDAWERSYGDLGWHNLIPERVMPWYFATYDGRLCHGYGVKTDTRALCFWQLDQAGVSLWLNVANGGGGVQLGDRRLEMATIVSHQGIEGIEPIDCITTLCKTMCARPSRKMSPIYGVNDWDYSYGQSTAESILRDTDTVVQLSPAGGIRPFSVIDGGWTSGTVAWPDMAKLASAIKQRNARPGIWVRPLLAPADAPRSLLLSAGRFGERTSRAGDLAYDPTIPEAREKVSAKLKETLAWGYEMVKHDYSTYDLLGQWGFEMGPQPTLPGWSLYDRSRTNAEIVADLYAMLRESVGEQMLIDGCNTIGHLGQGVFDLQRSGDDTSGHQWERTRRMGVNTLSFRLPQNGTFFVLDADIVAITEAIPWELSKQFLDVVARSGTATILSIEPSALNQEQRSAIKEAFRVAAAGDVGAKPVDWMETSAPEHWKAKLGSTKEQRTYRWSGADGASPFLSP